MYLLLCYQEKLTLNVDNLEEYSELQVSMGSDFCVVTN